MGSIIQAACGCHCGLRCRKNKDNFYFDEKCLEKDNEGLKNPAYLEEPLKNSIFYGVFDGMGGAYFGEIERAALKMISTPQNESDIEEIHNDGYDDESITVTLQNYLQSIVAEYSLMRKMSGCISIVQYEDIRYEHHAAGFCWDIFIKMELLLPLNKVVGNKVPEQMVVKIAKDIYNALVACKEYDIVHRDIKPQSIFVSKYGDYKLGDFDIAKTVERTSGRCRSAGFLLHDPQVDEKRKIQYNNKKKGGGVMPFEIVRNDITNMQVDAIVNSANPQPVVGLGTDSMIHEKAGPRLLRDRQKIGNIPVGQAAVTRGYDLKARYVIHTVGPVWNGGTNGEEQLLRSCYDRSLKLALEYGCRSVAFPLISSGNYGFPKDKALQIAIGAFGTFLLEHEMQIYLVVFDKTAFRLSEKLFHKVASFIDEHYVDTCEMSQGVAHVNNRSPRLRARRDMESYEASVCEAMPCMPMAASKAVSLEEMLRREDAGFTETLLKLIDKSGKKDSEIYKRANISKQHFSKIRNNPAYKPTKPTAIALALALELDLEQTRDLIGRAGYALTNSSKFDLIIRYFIQREQYDIMEINATLFEFDQSLLGV